MSICIRNAEVLSGRDGGFRRGAVLVEGETIAAVAHGEDAPRLAARAARVVDAGGLALVPGLVNAHHHAYANVLRGTENALPLELWAPYTVMYGRGIGDAMLRLAILIGAAEMLRAGVTSVIDHSPPVRRASVSFDAHVESGMRVGFAPFLHDLHDHDLLRLEPPAAVRRDLEGVGFATADVVADAFRQLAGADGAGRIRVLLGPNAPQRCSPQLLDLWATLRERHGFASHTHLLETRAQAVACKERWPDGVVAELDRRGLLDRHLAVAHGIWLDAAERDLLAARGVTVVHNPASNLMLGSGILPSADLRRRGVTLALGSDSANTGGPADPFELMRLASAIGRVGTPWDTWLDAGAVWAMATEGGAAALGLGGRTGRIEEGCLADLVLVDLRRAAAVAMSPSVETLVRHGAAAAVRSTMVGGRWVYRDGAVLSFDEEAVLREFRDASVSLRDYCDGAQASARAAHKAFDSKLRDFTA